MTESLVCISHMVWMNQIRQILVELKGWTTGVTQYGTRKQGSQWRWNSLAMDCKINMLTIIHEQVD